jgi:hypothetical protein
LLASGQWRSRDIRRQILALGALAATFAALVVGFLSYRTEARELAVA